MTAKADALDIAQDLLAKYKDPMARVTGLKLSTDDINVTEAFFRLDLEAKVPILRTPGGGARLDQSAWVQNRPGPARGVRKLGRT